MTWLAFLLTAGVVVASGTWLARYGDVIAERSGLGRAWIGMILIAATTSLPELFTGVSASLQGLGDIAVGNLVGACMVNLLLLSLMDSLSPRVPLFARVQQGHALSVGLGVVLTGLTALGLAAGERMPVWGWWSVLSPVTMVVYLLGARLVFFYERRRVAGQAEVVSDGLTQGMRLGAALIRYLAAAAVLIVAALFLPGLAERLAAETGLGEALVGQVFVALTTTLPEMVVSIMAVRMGALDLAMGNALGSNLFNLFILSICDAFYRDGALLGAADASLQTAAIGALVMYGVVLVGLTYQAREKKLRINWDTACLAMVYACTIWIMLG